MLSDKQKGALGLLLIAATVGAVLTEAAVLTSTVPTPSKLLLTAVILVVWLVTVAGIGFYAAGDDDA